MRILMAVLCLIAASTAGASPSASEAKMILDRALDDVSAGRLAQAESGMRRAVAASAPRSEEEVDSLNGLAWVLMDTGRVEDAEEVASRALKTAERLYGKYSPRLVVSLNTLAEGCIVRRDFDAAETLLRRATRLASMPGATPLLPAAVAVRRGLLWLTMGRYHEAEPVLEHSLALAEEQIGPNHPALRPMLYTLARCYRLRNRPQEAAALDNRFAALGGAVHGASLAQGGR